MSASATLTMRMRGRRYRSMAPTPSLSLFRRSQYPSDEWRTSYRRVLGPLIRLARSAILSMAFCQPASASFMALSVAALASSTPEFEALLGSVVGGIGKSEFGCSPVKAALQPWRNLSTLSRGKPCPLCRQTSDLRPRAQLRPLCAISRHRKQT
jgi:hypothetical protein